MMGQGTCLDLGKIFYQTTTLQIRKKVLRNHLSEQIYDETITTYCAKKHCKL